MLKLTPTCLGRYFTFLSWTKIPPYIYMVCIRVSLNLTLYSYIGVLAHYGSVAFIIVLLCLVQLHTTVKYSIIFCYKTMYCADSNHVNNRGGGTGPADPATARPLFWLRRRRRPFACRREARILSAKIRSNVTDETCELRADFECGDHCDILGQHPD